MKNFLAMLVLGVALGVTVFINAEEAEEEEVQEPTPKNEAPDADPDDETPAVETETEEPEEASTPLPTTPWKRLPVTTKIPVNYDIDLPQDI